MENIRITFEAARVNAHLTQKEAVELLKILWKWKNKTKLGYIK